MKKNIYIITFIIILIDQFIKNIIVNNIVLSDTISVIGDFFYITHTKNTGGAWSLFDGYPIVLAIIGAGCVIGINMYLNKKEKFNQLELIYYGLLMGGIIGNFIDRLVLDGVIDYLGFNFGSYSFPIFNFADIAIVIGVMLMFIDTIRGEINEHRSRKG